MCVGGRQNSPFPWAPLEPGESFLPGDQLGDEQAQWLGPSVLLWQTQEVKWHIPTWGLVLNSYFRIIPYQHCQWGRYWVTLHLHTELCWNSILFKERVRGCTCFIWFTSKTKRGAQNRAWSFDFNCTAISHPRKYLITKNNWLHFNAFKDIRDFWFGFLIFFFFGVLNLFLLLASCLMLMNKRVTNGKINIFEGCWKTPIKQTKFHHI